MCEKNETGAGHCRPCLERLNLARPSAEPEATDPKRLLVTRQDFLRGLAAVAFLPILKVPKAFAETTPPPRQMTTREIAPGIFVHHGLYQMQNPQNQGDMANASFVVGRDAVAVIDTSGSAVCGYGLRDAIRNVTSKPIRYVINTHMHPDHVFGNTAFRQDSPIYVGHYKLAAALKSRSEQYLTANLQMIGAKSFKGSEIILPTLPVRKSFDLDLGGRTLHCEAQRTAHTDNDLTITDSLTDTLFMGDLLFAVDIPTLDGSLTGWIGLLHDFDKRKAARVVPGHGPDVMQFPAALRPEQRYLQTLATDVRKLIKDGVPLEQAINKAGYSEEHSWKLFNDYHKRNVTAAYAELEWE